MECRERTSSALRNVCRQASYAVRTCLIGVVYTSVAIPGISEVVDIERGEGMRRLDGRDHSSWCGTGGHEGA